MITIGIDPGQTGAIVFVENKQVIKYLNISDFVCNRLIDFWALYESRGYLDYLTAQIYIEKPWTQGNQGGTEVIWRNYQSLWLLFTNPVEIRPQEWQKALGISTSIPKSIKGKERREIIKLNSLKFAQEHSDLDFNLYGKTGQVLKGFNSGLADAFCIGWYGANKTAL